MTKTLEQKTEKFDWKELIPVYGFYQMNKNIIMQKSKFIPVLRFFGITTYQTISTLAITGGLYALAEKLF